MGTNLRSCCHRCKVQVLHWRSEECLTMIPFYRKHEVCMKIHPGNVETLDDQLQEADWMGEYQEVNDRVKEIKEHCRHNFGFMLEEAERQKEVLGG